MLNPSSTFEGYNFTTGWATKSKIEIPNSNTVWKVEGNNFLAPNNPIKIYYENSDKIRFEKTISIDNKYLFEIKQNLINSAILSVGSVSVTLLLGVPAANAFARYKFKGGEDIAFTLLSFRFAPALLIILPLNLYFSEIGLYDSYFALIWVYQLITLPLLLWIVRGYFEDISPDIEYAYRLDGHSWFQSFWKISIPLAKPGIAAASLLCFIYAWNNFVFALILGSSQIQPVTVGALAFITASAIPYGLIACGIVVSVLPTLILALFIQKYLVQGLSLGAIKG
mgnify:CR=1 FL=1